MRLTLTLPATALVGESPDARLTLENDGPAPLAVPDPTLNREAPTLRLRTLPAGEERLFVPGELWDARREPHAPAHPDQGPTTTLAPGATLDHPFSLAERCELPAAGRHELTAEVGDERSPPAPLEVQRVAPGAVVPEAAPLDGGDTWLVWTHETHAAEGAAEGPGEATVLVRRLGLGELGDLERLAPSVRVGAATAGVRPVLSTPTRGQAVAERHVAWTSADGARLTAVTVGQDGRRATATLDLAPRGALLGPPVAEGDGGASLLVGHDQGPGGCEVAIVRLRGDSAAVEHRRLAGRQPAVWGRLVAPLEGARRALLAVPDKAAVRLLTLPWVLPAPGAAPVPAEVPGRLLELPGRFAAAAASIDPDDVMRGALLTWAPAPLGGERLLLARWTLDRGGYRAERPTPWAWPERLVGAPLQAHVDDAGVVHLLFRDAEGEWALARQLERPTRLVGPAARELEPLVGPPGLTFVSAGPVVLWHRPSSGLEARGVGFRLEADPAELVQPDLAPEPAEAGGGA